MRVLKVSSVKEFWPGRSGLIIAYQLPCCMPASPIRSKLDLQHQQISANVPAFQYQPEWVIEDPCQLQGDPVPIFF